MSRQLLCGYKPRPKDAEAIVKDTDVRVYEYSSRQDTSLGPMRGNTVLLFDSLLRLAPNWRRGAQGIGDCVSWGYELGCTLLTATDIVLKQKPWEWRGEFATEPIYGGSRVEARGVRAGGWSDGSYGAAAAKWLTKWGALLRSDYSIRTGQEAHNLTAYSSKKAKSWGNYGCGGQRDKNALDEVARETPVKSAYLVRSFEQAAKAIENGYPVVVCSMYGFGSRGADGFAQKRGSWAHCMCFTGVRYDKPGLLLTNSWGNSWGTRAPFYPRDYYPEVKKCSAWISARNATGMLKGGDSYALSDIRGLKRREIKWEELFIMPGRR